MNLFLSIITGLLFVLCIFLICNYFLILDKTEYKYRYVLSTVITIFSTVCVYFSSNIHINVVVTIASITVVTNLCFKASIEKKILVSLWSYVIVSLFSLIVEMGIDTIFSIVSIKQNRLISCISIMIVILFVIGVKQVTSKKNKEGLKNIKVKYLLLYTALMLIDEMTMTMMAAVTMEEMLTKNKIYYGVASFLMATAIFIQLGAVIILMVSRDKYKEKEEITHQYLNQ